MVDQARRYLVGLEERAVTDTGGAQQSLPLAPRSEPEEHPVISELRELDPDSLSPREALELLYRLQSESKR